MHALHGISFRRSSASFKAHSQGDSPSDERMAKWRHGLSLHKSARSSPEVRVGDVARAPPKEVVGLMARCTSIPTVQNNVTMRRPSARGVLQSDNLLAMTPRYRNVDSSSDFDNAPTLHATELKNHWNVKGWAVQSNLGNAYCSDSDREHSRGRKRCRNL